MADPDRTAKRNLYLNTTVFCLIAGVFSALLLLLLLYGGEVGGQLTVFVFTAELGIIAVVINALVNVVRAERKARALARNKADNLVAVKACPDYYTIGAGNVCVNSFRAPPNPDGPDGSTTVYTLPGAKAQLKLADYDKQPLRKLCGMVADQQAPWLDLQAACSASHL